MLVGAVLAPQCADDTELGECRDTSEHRDQQVVLPGSESVLGDEGRRDGRIAGPGLDRARGSGHAAGFFGGGAAAFGGVGGTFGSLTGAGGAAPRRASDAGIIFGALLLRVYRRAGERNTASTTLSASRMTMSLMPQVFSQPFLYRRKVDAPKVRTESGGPRRSMTCCCVMAESIVATACAWAERVSTAHKTVIPSAFPVIPSAARDLEIGRAHV